MLPKSQLNLLDLLYQALNSPRGLIVTTTNVDALRQKLYRVRKEDPDLACLSLTTSRTSPESELWIVKNES